MAVDKGDPKDPKDFVIDVIYNGITKKLKVTRTDTVAATLAAAIALFPITEQRHLLALFDEGGTELVNEAQTLKDAGVKKKSRLVLRQSVVKGG